MMGSLSRADVWFVVVVGGATLIKGAVWFADCAVANAPLAWPGSLAGSGLDLEASWKGGAEMRK